MITTDIDMIHILIFLPSYCNLNFLQNTLAATIQTVLTPATQSLRNGIIPGTTIKLSSLLSVNVGSICLVRFGKVSLNLLFDTLHGQPLTEPVFPMLQRIWHAAMTTTIKSNVDNVPSSGHSMARLLMQNRLSYIFIFTST